MFELSFILVFFRMVHNKKLFKGPGFSIGSFQMVQREVIYFPDEVMKYRHKKYPWCMELKLLAFV